MMNNEDQPRIAPLSKQERSPEQQTLIDDVGSELNIFTTLIRHPDLFADFHTFAGGLLRRSGLPERDRETLILRTAFRCRSDYEWVQHNRIAADVGLTPALIAALAEDNPLATLSPEHALLARAADQLTSDRDLDAATWHEMRERYTEEQMIEICMLVGNYAMIAGVLKSLQVALEDGQTHAPWR
jgi:4-carboxymuconolactone decarboxylase